MKIKKIRHEIDLIDTEIVKLLSRRSSLVSEASKNKKSIDAVRDPQRVETIIKSVRQKAVKTGLDPQIAETIYRNIIDCFIIQEIVEFNGMIIEYQDI
ncbi:MAG: chorismate mutase [Nitrospirota bacterium]